MQVVPPVVTVRRKHTRSLAYFAILLIVSGDIEKNPGPIRFPCGGCGKPVAKHVSTVEYAVTAVTSGFMSNVLALQMISMLPFPTLLMIGLV